MPATQSVRVILVDKDLKSLDKIYASLQTEGHQVAATGSAGEFLSKIGQMPCDVVCVGAKLPGDQLAEVLGYVGRCCPGLPVIAFTEGGKDGATFAGYELYDELTQPVNTRKLQMVVRNAANHYQMRLRIAQLEREVSDRPFVELVGQSAVMRRLYSEMEQVAHRDVSVLLVGESGTGKELVAKTIHEHSGRKAGAFVVVNCAALPEQVQEAELFGVDGGREGKLEQANGGTLLLKNISSLEQKVQSRLLQAIEQRRFYRVGGTQERRSDFRVMTATNRGLSEDVQRGLVREDLYFRLAVFEMVVPPLRERLGDVVGLARYFVGVLNVKGAEGASFSADALALLEVHHWPGNVRELRNAVERALVVCKSGQILPKDLPPQVQAAAGGAEMAGGGLGRGRRSKMRLVHSGEVDGIAQDSAEGANAATLADVERVAIEAMMKRVNGNISLAARQLGIGRSTLYRKLRSYGYKG